MKVIETLYKGYKFRSRLEARWAVYFDFFNIDWIYELEGFEFDDGTYYLPDFFLPQVEMWAEVKPIELNKEELRKVCLLVDGSGFDCLLLEGVPDIRSYRYVGFDDNLEIYYDKNPEDCFFDCVVSNYKEYNIQDKRFYMNTGGGVEKHFKSLLYPAVEAARSARFEFGEKG